MRLFSRSRRSPRSRIQARGQRCKPILEALEDRRTPALVVNGSPTALEGTPYAITLGQPNIPDVTAYTIDWGDGAIQTIAAADLPANREVEHLYADGSAQHSILVQATNASGTFGAVPVAAYLFDGSLAAAPGDSDPALLLAGTGGAGTFVTDTVLGQTRTVYQFGLQSGLSLNTAGLVAQNQYTIEMVFRFDDVIGWQKFIDFNNRQSDPGMYVDNGNLEFYPNAASGAFPVGQYQRVVVTRSAADSRVTVYLNGIQVSTFIDTNGWAVIGAANTLHFFLDDDDTGFGEVSFGRVAQIRLYNSVLPPDQIAALDFNMLKVAVGNVAPTLNAAGNQQAVTNVGETFDLGAFLDPGADAPWQVSVDWGDQSSSSFDAGSAGSLSAPHTYGLVGDYQVTVTVTDKDGASDTATFTVNVVENTPPSDVAIDLGAGPVSEGDLVTLTVTFADPDDGQAHSLVIDFGDNQSETVQLPAGVFTYTTTHTYADNGSHAIQATVTDPFNESASASVNLGVDNSDPTYTPAADQSGFRIGDLASIDLGAFADAGLLDGPWSVTVSWGDGASDSFDATSQGALGSLGHSYAASGLYSVEVTVTDKDGGSASGSFQVIAGLVVVNTNDSGFGSLREAIEDANALPGPDYIEFQIGSGPQTIVLGSALPALTEAVVLDGWSQPGFAGVPLVSIDGGGNAGLSILGGDSTVRGLGFDNFAGAAVNLEGGGNNQVLGNRFGPGIAVAIHGLSAGNVVGAPGSGLNTFDNAAVVFADAGSVALLKVDASDDGYLDVSKDAVIVGTLYGVSDVRLQAAGGIAKAAVVGTSGADQFEIHADGALMNGVSITSADAAAWVAKGKEGADTFVVTSAGAPFKLKGGAGADVFSFPEGASITGIVDGGAGADVLDYSARSSAVHVDLGAGTATATGGVVDVGHVLGGSGNDCLVGNADSNILVGGAGDDYLKGAGGADALFGGDGNDVLLGGAGVDLLFGENGRDLLIGGTGIDVLDGGADDDLLIGSSTVYDNDRAGLDAIMAVWTRGDIDYKERVRILTTASCDWCEPRLSNKTVIDDCSLDLLNGGSGDDLFGLGKLDLPLDFNPIREYAFQVRK